MLCCPSLITSSSAAEYLQQSPTHLLINPMWRSHLIYLPTSTRHNTQISFQPVHLQLVHRRRMNSRCLLRSIQRLFIVVKVNSLAVVSTLRHYEGRFCQFICSCITLATSEMRQLLDVEMGVMLKAVTRHMTIVEMETLLVEYERLCLV